MVRINTMFNYGLDRKKRERLFFSLPRPGYLKDIPFPDVAGHFRAPDDMYLYFHQQYLFRLPKELKDHRRYFKTDLRGFGEDAFHAMWYSLFLWLKPVRILEIGVYRGQTLSLFSLIPKMLGYEAEVHGISPFSSADDSVSSYLKSIDYYEDVSKNLAHFGLKKANLHKGYSNDREMVEVIRSHVWDLVYIDGSHDYEAVKTDFLECSQALRTGGLLILDDAAKFNRFGRFSFAFAGHPGPSQVADEIASNPAFVEIVNCGHNRVFQKKEAARS
jgi:hypothetical protein